MTEQPALSFRFIKSKTITNNANVSNETKRINRTTAKYDQVTRKILTLVQKNEQKEKPVNDMSDTNDADESADEYDLANDIEPNSSLLVLKNSLISESDLNRQNKINCEKFNISYPKNPSIYYPILLEWPYDRFPDWLNDNLERNGFKEPTPIQKALFPLLTDKKSIVGLSQTGSGKTAAFLIPIIYNLYKSHLTNPKSAELGPEVLILSPARELAQQIHKEALKLTKSSGIQSICIIGGKFDDNYFDSTNSSYSIICATPGRLLNKLSASLVSLDNCSTFIIDEADKMIDIDFKQCIEELMSHFHRPIQFILTSATLSTELESNLSSFLKNAVFVKVESSKEELIRLKHTFIEVYEKDIKSTLISTLQGNHCKTIIFANTKKTVIMLEKFLLSTKFRAYSLHSNKTQDLREKALRDFVLDKNGILVATDVAGRGIDIKDVKLVLNYDLPDSFESYCHRVGRTARAGKTGSAISFVKLPADLDTIGSIRKKLKSSQIQHIYQNLNYECSDSEEDIL